MKHFRLFILTMGFIILLQSCCSFICSKSKQKKIHDRITKYEIQKTDIDLSICFNSRSKQILLNFFQNGIKKEYEKLIHEGRVTCEYCDEKKFFKYLDIEKKFRFTGKEIPVKNILKNELVSISAEGFFLIIPSQQISTGQSGQILMDILLIENGEIFVDGQYPKNYCNDECKTGKLFIQIPGKMKRTIPLYFKPAAIIENQYSLPSEIPEPDNLTTPTAQTPLPENITPTTQPPPNTTPTAPHESEFPKMECRESFLQRNQLKNITCEMNTYYDVKSKQLKIHLSKVNHYTKQKRKYKICPEIETINSEPQYYTKPVDDWFDFDEFTTRENCQNCFISKSFFSNEKADLLKIDSKKVITDENGVAIIQFSTKGYFKTKDMLTPDKYYNGLYSHLTPKLYLSYDKLSCETCRKTVQFDLFIKIYSFEKSD